MQVYQTVAQIKDEFEILLRNITGRKQLTAGEVDIVNAAIIDAYQEVLLEYGITDFRFLEVDISVTTTSGANFVNLDEYVFRALPGTLRIKSENQLLSLIEEAEVYLVDPDGNEVGVPRSYFYRGSDDPNIIQIGLYPTPNSTFTITGRGMKYPTDVITNFPISVVSAIKYKAKALSCMHIGIGQLKPQFDDAYEKIIEKVKDSYEEDRPKHVGRSRRVARPYYNEDQFS